MSRSDCKCSGGKELALEFRVETGFCGQYTRLASAGMPRD